MSALPSQDVVLGYIGQIIPLVEGALYEYGDSILFKVGKPIPPLTTHPLIIGVEWFVEDDCLNISVHRIANNATDLLTNSYLVFNQVRDGFIPVLKELLHKADSQLIIEDITKEFSRF
jgi:hypothetical protein